MRWQTIADDLIGCNIGTLLIWRNENNFVDPQTLRQITDEQLDAMIQEYSVVGNRPDTGRSNIIGFIRASGVFHQRQLSLSSDLKSEQPSELSSECSSDLGVKWFY